MRSAITIDKPDDVAHDNTDQAALWSGLNKILIFVAIAPLLHALATWDIDGKLTQMNQWLRLYSLPVVLLELFVLLTALDQGWRPHLQLRSLPKPAKLLLFTAALSVFITSWAISPNPAISVLFVVRYAVHGFVLGAIVYLIARTADFRFERWAGTVTAGGLAYTALLTIFCLIVPDPANFSWVERLPSATNVRQIGNVVGLIVLAPTTMFMFARKDRTHLIALVAITVLLTYIMWSGTRAALLAFAVAVCFAAYLQRNTIRVDRLLCLAGLSVVALFLSLMLPSPGPDFGMIRVAESVGSGDVSSGRLKVWSDAIAAIGNAPFFGHGAGMYREQMAVFNGYPYNHPHNFILQYLYDWGAFGGGAMLIIIAWIGIILLPIGDAKREYHFLAVCGYGALVSMALVEGTLFHPLPMLLGIALICPHLAFVRSDKLRMNFS